MKIVKLLFLALVLISYASCKNVAFDLETKEVSLSGKIKLSVKNQNISGLITKAEFFSGSQNIAYYNPGFKNSGDYNNDNIELAIIEGTEAKLYSNLQLKVTFEGDNGKTKDDGFKPTGFRIFKFSSILKIIKNENKNSVIFII